MSLGGIQISCFFFIALTVTPSDFTLGKKTKQNKKDTWELQFSGCPRQCVQVWSGAKCGMRWTWMLCGEIPWHLSILDYSGNSSETWLPLYCCPWNRHEARERNRIYTNYLQQLPRGTRVCTLWTDSEIPALLHLHLQEARLWQVTPRSRAEEFSRQGIYIEG